MRDIQPKLKNKKYVLIKPNNVTTTNQLGATHADALRGMLDYFSTRFKGPVVIAESSAGNTMQGFETFGYTKLAGEYKNQKVQLIDLNEEAKYVLLPLIDFDIHVAPVRLAARLIDPDAFVVSAACLKTHNFAVVTLSVKNMVLAAPLHYSSKENDPLERQAPLPRRGPPIHVQHVSHRPVPEAQLGRHLHRRL